MNNRELVQRTFIQAPCPMRWDDLDVSDAGNRQGRSPDAACDTKRFCHECKLNVYNITNMTEVDAAALLRQKDKRTCIFISVASDGTIITDNCPRVLRRVRNQVVFCAAVLALGLFMAAGMAAEAQGLVGAPVDPHNGMGGNIAQLADYGYDQARDVARLITGVSFVLAFFWPLARSKRDRIRVVIAEFFVLALIPILVHFCGTCYVNSIGGIGGGF
jgi:hypothetical protein